MARSTTPDRSTFGPAAALAAMFTATGITHLVRPRVFDPVVPPPLPGPARFWTISSGVLELGLAALVAGRSTRAAGGRLSALFLVAVLPANLRTLRVAGHRGPVARTIAWVRLPLQGPLIVLALRAAADPR